jgi:two-component system LytT family response regulator
MKIRTVIVDDMQLARDRLARYLEEDPDIDIIADCSGGAEAIDAILELKPDLLFLDVQMPQVGGFDVLEAIGAGAVPMVVFVTAYDQFALRAFEVNALDYLLKPFDSERLQATLERAKGHLRRREPNEVDGRIHALLESLVQRRVSAARMALRVDGRTVLVAPDDIDYIEAAGNYVRIQVGPDAHLIRERLTQMESRLDPETFVRIHRSTIVNVSRIKEMHPMFNGDQSLVLKGGRKLTMSRTFRERLMAVLELSKPDLPARE